MYEISKSYVQSFKICIFQISHTCIASYRKHISRMEGYEVSHGVLLSSDLVVCSNIGIFFTTPSSFQ